MARPGIVTVIPCHNEAATLGAVAAGCLRFGPVLVVDDGSTDASAAIARAVGAEVIAGPCTGYDGAVAAGLAAARARDAAYVVTLDADGEHDPPCVELFSKAFKGGADLVCGVRTRPQRAAEYVVDAYVRRVFGPADILCGMKGYSRAALAAWFDSGEPLLVNMAPAVVWLAGGGGFTDIPVTGHPREDQPRFGRALQANLRLLSTLPKLRALAARARGPSFSSPAPSAGEVARRKAP